VVPWGEPAEQSGSAWQGAPLPRDKPTRKQPRAVFHQLQPDEAVMSRKNVSSSCFEGL